MGIWYRRVREFVMTLKHPACPIIYVISKVKEDVVFVVVILLHRIISVCAVKLNSEQGLRIKQSGIKFESISWNAWPVKVNG